MAFDTPITWLVAEILVSILFVVCIIHASKQEHGTIKVLELFGFIFYSAIFENIGVYFQAYDYNLHRIMLIGKVPIEVLMVEAVIFYATLQLARKLHIPGWGMPFVVGFLASFQDMSLDPAAVFDLHLLDGVMSGQWNWTFRYAGSFVGIPFYNFSGWMYLMAYYVLAIQVGWWLYMKYQKEWVGYLYPFVGGLLGVALLVSPITRFLLFVNPFFSMYTQGAELTILVINYLLGLGILLRYQKVNQSFDLKRDYPIFVVPLVLHLYDILLVFALNLQVAYLPVLLVSAIHLGYLLYLYLKGKKLAVVSPSRAPVQSGI